MSSVVEELKQAVADGKVKQARRQKPNHPKGYEPGVEDFGDGTAVGVVALENADAHERDLIAGWQLDPDEWRIVGKVNCRRWQTYDERWLYYYKADLVRNDHPELIDYSDLIDEIKRFKGDKRPGISGDSAFVVCIADPQMGKADGYGVEGTVERWLKAIADVEKRVNDLRNSGRTLGTLYVFGMGDLVEGCDGHYAQQTFTVELNRRDQVKIVRRLLVKAIQRWATLFDNVVVACVGGNHGENRKNGKSFTDFADNDDVAIFEQVAEIFAENPESYGHVNFVIPNEELSLTLDVAGEIVTITHGHLARSGVNPQKKQQDWWMKQAHGMQPAGDSKILFTAHYHHFSVVQAGAKTHFQCPALEDRSDWWTNSTGQDSPAGVLTVVVGSNLGPSGWSDVQVVGQA